MAGIYIHIPYCKQACSYCDFHFSTKRNNLQQMLNSILKEIELRKNFFREPTDIQTIYFGGGTPSLLTPWEIKQILKQIQKYFSVNPNTEITLECNPDDISEDFIKDLKKININRLSIGIQSFEQEQLKQMNRAHNHNEALESIKIAKKYFQNISVDLIYGIPNTKIETWDKQLQTVFDLNIPHISCYALTVEPNTLLSYQIEKKKYPALDEKLAQQQFEYLIKRTKEKGYIHYELSNFGKKGFFSQNNTAYWQGKAYLGIGPAAHSFNIDQRSWNIANNTKYIKSISKDILPEETEILSQKDQYNEYIMTGLRTQWGINTEHVLEKFGVKFHEYLIKNSAYYIKKELLIFNKDKKQIYCSLKGKFLSDGISSDLFFV